MGSPAETRDVFETVFLDLHLQLEDQVRGPDVQTLDVILEGEGVDERGKDFDVDFGDVFVLLLADEDFGEEKLLEDVAEKQVVLQLDLQVALERVFSRLSVRRFSRLGLGLDV